MVHDDVVAPLRWGILSTGGIARSFARDATAAGIDVRAVGSRTIDAATTFAHEFDIPHAHGSAEDLAAEQDIDVIYVASPHPAHASGARLAIDAGKHVLVEKPFTINADEASAITEAASRRGVIAMEAMWTRYLPHMTRIRELIAHGALGEIRTLTADHTQSLPTDPAHRLNSLELGGGALLDLGVYPISFVIDVLGLPTRVTATARIGQTGADTEVATITVHTSGAIATTLSSSRARGANRAVISGTAARIEIDPVWYQKTGFSLIAPDDTVIERFESPDDGRRGMTYQARALERAVADPIAHPLVLDGAESVAIMRVLDEVRRQIGVVYPSE